MSSCSGNCSSCGSTSCSDRTAESLLAALNPHSTVKKVIAVVSGKGGVGKSTVTSMLAVAMARQGSALPFWMLISPVLPLPLPSVLPSARVPARMACTPL